MTIRQEAKSTTDARELHLAAVAARRFYIDDCTKMDIAAAMGVSRFRVARLLDLARSTGIVTISVAGDIDSELSSALEDRFGLREAIVLATPSRADDPTVRQLLGNAAGELLTQLVTRNDVLGLGWARTVLAMATSLTSLVSCPIVQLSGAQTRPDVESDSIGLVRDVAKKSGGPPAFFYAPMITASPAAARALRAQVDVAAAQSMYDRVTVAVVGVGGWTPPASTLGEALTPAELRMATQQGVHADLSGVLIDRNGRPVSIALAERIIAISATQLRAVPNVVAIAYGEEKADATRAAMRGGYVNTLVTNVSFAQSLLAGA